MFTLPLALGNLGVENCLRNRSLLGALALRACHVTVRCWEPWCEELFCVTDRSFIWRLWAFLGVLLGRFWGPFGLSWGPLGPSWGPAGSSGGILEAFGRLGALLGASWGGLGSLLGLSWGSLGPSWGPLGPFGGPLGPSWGPLGPFSGASGGLLGRLGTIFGASWAVFGRPWPEKARTRKTFKNPRKIYDFRLLGASWEASWRSLGASWGPSWTVLEPS